MRLGGLVAMVLAGVTGCGDDDGGAHDAGIVECPIGAPDVGTDCVQGAGICVYDGMNRNCPPITGTCECEEGAWTCAPPECSSCPETCNGTCCNNDDVCRQTSPDQPELDCGPQGDGTTPMYGQCGHESDCAGLRPICSPICLDGSCCTVTCESSDVCGDGTCTNGVCAPPA